jgi:ferric-dicitrate binding protein FerR (iron transport regulator)
MKTIKSGTRRTASRSAAFILAGAILGLLCTSPAARADDSVGAVNQISGGAQIVRAGATLAAQQGTPVKLHDQVTTGPGASVTLGFGDGSSVALGSSTSIAIEDASSVNGQPVPSRVTLLSGDIHANVPDKATGQQHSLEVDSENTKATGPSPNQ